jgi:LAS superfamily LD-carboxypeptidase LdcB
VYFLSENYEPPRLRDIDEEYVYPEGKVIQAESHVVTYLERMLAAAEDDGVDILVASGYRSFGEQAGLKSGYTVTYGTGANAFSADQGYSEHQLGTTFDFLTPSLVALDERFENTDAFRWLEDHAYKHGFILTYPRGNAYYVYEPWHWRFVGKDLARDLKRSGKDFYDLDQRELDKYLITIFE